jgi:hypothetical protein
VLGENLANNKTSARYFMKKDNNPKWWGNYNTKNAKKPLKPKVGDYVDYEEID